jgi:hypothetical protein
MNSMTGRLVAGCGILHAVGIIYGLYAGGVVLLLAAFGVVMLAAVGLIFVFGSRLQDTIVAERAPLHPYRKALTP